MTIAAWIATTFFALGALGIGIFVLHYAEEAHTKVIVYYNCYVETIADIP